MSSSDPKSAPNPRHEDLISYFERSAVTVRTLLDRFEHTYLRPKLLHLKHAFHRRPVRVTFLATFAALAFLPVISFLGFSLFILASFTFFALTCALIASTIAILAFASILAVTLFTLFGISVFLTLGIMSTFLFVRFVLHVRSEGPREGILEWGKEMKRGLYGPALSSTPPSPPSSSHHHKDHHHQQQQQQQHVQFDPDVTLGPQAQDHEIRESDGGGGVAILDGRNHTKPGHKQHKNQHPYPRRLHQDHHHHHTIKGGHQSPGLSSGSSSSSSTSDDDDGEGEENDRSTLGSTVVVERVSEGEGKVMGGSIVEDSPIMVKTEIGIR